MRKKYSFIKPDTGIHIAFVLMIILPTAFTQTYIIEINLFYYLTYVIFLNSLYLVPTYLNAYWWIPNLYRKDKKLIYFLVLILAAFLSLLLRIKLDNHVMPSLGIKMELIDFKRSVYYFLRMCSLYVVSLLLFYLRERIDQQEALNQAKYEKLTAEMNHLKSQINPHFLFNTLNNLYGLALENSDKTPEIILKLSKMMDYMLYETDEAKVYLKKDIENINNFLDIERIRQGNDAQIKFECHGDISTQKIVPLLLLPLIENAFKYGVKDMVSSGLVDIELNVNEHSLEMNVKNIYNLSSQINGRHGIGLSNLNKRLELFYPGRHQLIIKNEPPYYNVYLSIELNN